MVTDGWLKLDYASVIFVDPWVQIDETELDFLSIIAAGEMDDLNFLTTQHLAHTKHDRYIHVSHGSLAMRLRFGRIFNNQVIANSLSQSMPVE